MRRRALFLAVSAALVLAGCGRHRAGHRPGETGGGGESLNAAGETPSWSAVARPGSLIVSVGDAAPLRVAPEIADHGKAGTSWRGDLPSGAGTVSLDVTPKPCRDSETGLTYPLTAVAGVQGRRYAGCAAPPGQGLGPRA